MANFPLSNPQFSRPYVVAPADSTTIEDYGGPEQRYFRSIRISGTADAGTSNTALVDSAAFAGYTSAGLAKCRIAVLDRNSIYSITSKTNDNTLVIAKIIGDGGFTTGDSYAIAMMKIGFELDFAVITAAEQLQIKTFWLYHQKYVTFSWTDPYESKAYTVRFDAEPTFALLQRDLSGNSIFSCSCKFIEVI